jgi:hypothetical protein
MNYLPYESNNLTRVDVTDSDRHTGLLYLGNIGAVISFIVLAFGSLNEKFSMSK